MEEGNTVFCDVFVTANLQKEEPTIISRRHAESGFAVGLGLTFHCRIAGGRRAQGPNTRFPSTLKPAGL